MSPIGCRVRVVIATGFVCLASASAGCSSSGSTGAPTTATDAGADATDAAGGNVASCDGAIANGLLGTWTTTEQAGGDGPSGIVEVTVTHSFCGMASSGTTRYTEDGLGTPTQGCHRVADIRGTFTVDGNKLTITNSSGFSATRDCPDPTANFENPWSGPPDTRVYEMTLNGDELTLKLVDPAVGSSPETFSRNR